MGGQDTEQGRGGDKGRPNGSPLRLKRFALFALLALLLGPFGVRCAAHPATIASATAKVQADGRFQVEARFDLLAFVLDDTIFRIGDAPMNALLDGPPNALQAQLAEAERRFRREFKAIGGGAPGDVDSVAFPTLADVQKWRDSGIKPRLPVTLTVTVQGHLPPGAQSVSFRFPSVLGTMVVTTEIPYQEPTSEPVEAGAFSTPVSLTQANVAAIAPTVSPPAPPVPAAKPVPIAAKPVPRIVKPPRPVAKSVAVAPTAPAKQPQPALVAVKPTPVKPSSPKPLRAAEGRGDQRGRGDPAPTNRHAMRRRGGVPPPSSVAGTTSVPPSLVARAAPPVPSRPSWGVVVGRYVRMGFAHIMPEGLDHILFVLGLFLLSTRLKALLWQITAFTVAHSLTLALALYGVVRLPSSIIEPIIAASIAFVAIENLFTTELKPWRPFVVFGFGLVHGMGFAGALKDLGLHRPDFLTALLGFNVGVELGQLSVVALALLAVGWFRHKAAYRKFVVVPASVLIAAVAIFWTIQRIV